MYLYNILYTLYIYIYTHTYICIYVLYCCYIYIYRERERCIIVLSPQARDTAVREAVALRRSRDETVVLCYVLQREYTVPVVATCSVAYCSEVSIVTVIA